MSNGLRNLTSSINEAGSADAPTVTMYGTGISLLDYRPRGDGTFEATRWVTALFLPIIPGPTWVIRPGATLAASPTMVVDSFKKLSEHATPWSRIWRCYVRYWGTALASILPFALLMAFAPKLREPWDTLSMLTITPPFIALFVALYRQDRLLHPETPKRGSGTLAGETLGDKLASAGIGLAVGLAMVLWGDGWQVNGVPVRYVGYFAMACAGGSAVWALLTDAIRRRAR